MKKKPLGFVVPKGADGVFKLNQHAHVFEHKTTKRKRTRAEKKRFELQLQQYIDALP